MENTGLVTYRETLLLLDPAQAAHEERLDVAETVAHELAHMWFGDLVTMRWWNGIWLNEAFATFMSYLCVDAMEPSWRVFDSFQAIRMTAFEVDSLASTRPIEFPVESPDEASGMFDTLTYTKGGAVLRMIEQWLGPERFRDGIRRYLATHAYGNTETHHLWDALEEQTGQPVRRIMDAWIFQPGYPAIEVRRHGDVVRLTQHRFAPSLSDDDTTWPVPLIVRQRTPDGDVLERVLVEAGRARHPAGASRRAGGGERRGLRVRSDVLRRRAPRAAPRARGRTPARGASGSRRRRVGGGGRRAGRGGDVPRSGARLRRRDRAGGVADDHGGAGLVRPLPGGRAAGTIPRRGPRAGAARARPARVGSRGPRTPTSIESSGAI